MPLLSKKYRVRSIESIIAEIELIHKNYQAARITFEDSLFCSKKEWLEGFCEEYKRRGLHKKIQWGFETRIDTIDFDMLKQAKEAGCIYTFFGIESGNEMILKKSKKNYNRQDIIDKMNYARQAGIDEIKLSIILGLPYETRETIKDTFSLLEEIPFDNAGINILDIYPGTEVFGMADRGEGGLRWLPGKRMNWNAYMREDAMAEVNDMNAAELAAARDRALRIVAQKLKKKWANLVRKRMAYTLELAMTNRPKLWRYIKNSIKGLK